MTKIVRRKHARKLRGRVTHGHGRVGKHRKHASGRGNAGGMHHHRIWFTKFHPEHFGKNGMRKFFLHAQHKSNDSINVNKLVGLVGEESVKQAQTAGKALVIDVVQRGYDKVTGTGALPKVPFVVRARYFSKRAETKIRAAGGIAQLRA